jgi:hypothetical protein
VAHGSIPADTDPAAYDVLVDCWRVMPMAERVALIEQLNLDLERIALTGIQMDQPALSDIEVRHELARRRFGAELADEAYPRLI